SFEGYDDLLNNIDSEFGRRWHNSLVDRLHIQGNGVLLVTGEQQKFWFESLGGGAFERQRGEAGFSDLVQNLNGTYTLTDKSRTVFEFSSIGLLASKTDVFGNTTTYSYIDADGDMVVDELEEIEDWAGRT